MKKQVGRATERSQYSSVYLAESLRLSILDEEQLVKLIAEEEAFRRANPEGWRSREAARLAANRELEPTNRRLRELGLRPVSLRPSLGERRQELQRRENENAAAIAALRAARSELQPQSHGTGSARRRTGSHR